ncbi:MAG: diguanylate cyclase, partial [Burkholderiaceae bacterium]
ILMPDTDLQAAQGFAERLRRKIELTPLIHQDVEIPITISIGLTMILVDDDLPEQVFARCDRALYAAKHHGRNRVEIIEE